MQLQVERELLRAFDGGRGLVLLRLLQHELQQLPLRRPASRSQFTHHPRFRVLQEGGRPLQLRIGFGNDVHRLVRGRPLVLGGVGIEADLGLDGHSDADVLTHAVMDAVLGAVGKGDIGRQFPDTDPSFKDANSLELLERVAEIMRAEGFRVNNLDATVVAQRPRLAPHIPEMENRLAAALGVSPERVNVKATTTEGLGYCGRGEAMEAFAVVSLAGEG